MGQMFWQWISEPANQLICIIGFVALIIGFCAGLMVRRAKAGKVQSLAREGDKAFFKGIQYILSNDHDHAIEEFTKSVQVNSETIETYVALGNLYRSKGDIDRAIRIPAI